jgi:hypothetical protein
MAFGSNTVSFASAGSTFGPWGTAAGAVIGFGLDLWGSKGQAEADLLQAKSDALNYRTAALQTGVQIDQAKSDISAYETFLSAFPNYADLEKNKFEASSRQEFRSLMENYGMGNVAAGRSGRVGGSFGLVVGEAKKELVDFSGEDLALGGDDGGRYQMARTELFGNLTSQENQAKGQLDILRSSLSVLDETLGLYNQAEQDAQARVNQEQKAAST